MHKEFLELNNKKMIPSKKWVKVLADTSPKKIYNGTQTHKKVFHVICHWRNANYNSEILLYAYKNWEHLTTSNAG